MNLRWIEGEKYSSLYDDKRYRGIVYNIPTKFHFHARAYPGVGIVAEVATFSSLEEAKAWLYTVVRLGD